MRIIKYIFHAAIIGLVLTLFSSCIYSELPPPYPSNAYSYVDKERTLVAAGGWPYPYARDGSVSSPMGHASILGVWVASDEFIQTAFLKTYAFWQGLATFLMIGLYFMRRSRRRQTRK